MKKLLIHPLIFAFFPILSLFLFNWGQVAVREAIRSIVVVGLLGAAIFLLALKIARKTCKAAIITSLFLILFFSHYYVISAFAVCMGADKSSSLYTSDWISVLWLCIWASCFVLLSYLLVRSKRDFNLFTTFLNIMSLVLVVTLLVQFIPRAVDSRAGSFTASWQEEIERESQEAQGLPTQNLLPDIYYIILDGYAGADILRELYAVDISDLLSFLTNKGFYVATESRSNYAQTVLSLASSLNLMYLDDVAEQIGSSSRNRLPLRVIIENNRVAEELKRHGYRTITFPTGYSITEMYSADSSFSPWWSITGFENILLGTTPLPILLELPFLKTQYDLHRERILYVFDHLPDVAEDDSPTFAFAHILAPHAPFVLKADGNATDPEGRLSIAGIFSLADANDFATVGGKRQYAEGYRDQVFFVTQRVQRTIEEILARSAQPPIIILQADHGPGSMLRWGSIENSYLPERMSILNAYYFPDQDYESLYPSISPVNTFRIVLDQYFGADYGTLEDKSFFSALDSPYKLSDVTDKVRASSSN